MYNSTTKFRFLVGVIVSVYFINIHQVVWAKDTLSIGVLPRHSYTETFKMFLPLAKHLSHELGMKVNITTTKNFDAFWQNVEQQKYDVIHVNQYQYLTAKKKFGYQILLKNEEYGDSSIRSIIVVRKDSGINTLQDLKDKHIIFGGNKTAMMSYHVPRTLLQNNNITPEQYHSSFAVTPPNALVAVYLKSADACGIGDVVLKLKSVTNVVDINKMKIIARSEAIPHLAWATQKTLTKKQRQKILKSFLKLNVSEQGAKILERANLTGIHPATDKEYTPLKQYIGE